MPSASAIAGRVAAQTCLMAADGSVDCFAKVLSMTQVSPPEDTLSWLKLGAVLSYV